MNATLKPSRRLAVLLLVGGIALSSIALSGCAGLSTTPSAALQQQIESARTRADHDALAVYYERQAAAARVTAAEHRDMATSYKGMAYAGKAGLGMPTTAV